METMKEAWYNIENADLIDSPALIIYPDRVKENINRLKEKVQDIKRLRPHVKTHKTIEVSRMLIEAGIEKFKCSTIAEAEMLGKAGAKDVLMSYQPVGPKAVRFVALIKKYPAKFSCLIDNATSLHELSQIGEKEGITVPVFMDINVGMDRTGIYAGPEAIELYGKAKQTPFIEILGLHIYDGHFRQIVIEERAIACDKAFAPVEEMGKALIEKGYPKPVIVAGGSPTFPIHIKRKDVELSPGTFVFWDKGYHDTLPEQSFLHAALVLTRVISLPDKNKICVDLGYKSIASESELSKRVEFLNAPNLKVVGHSEEHLVLEAPEGHAYKVGDVLYGLPYHICPTCALYEKATIIKNNNKASGEWKIIARDRAIEV